MTLWNVKIDKYFIRDLLVLLSGVALYILSVRIFVIPNHLASNGVAGFSVLIDFVFGINPALTFFLVNIPLFILGKNFLSRRELLLSIPGAAAMSIWMIVYEAIGIPGVHFSKIFYAGLFDGILSGTAAGLVIISGGTFGGALLLGRILEEKWNMQVDKVLFGVDAIVLSLSLLTFLSFPNFGVTLVSCYIFSKITIFVGKIQYSQVREKFTALFPFSKLGVQRTKK